MEDDGGAGTVADFLIFKNNIVAISLLVLTSSFLSSFCK